jgi:hypothetical protein
MPDLPIMPVTDLVAFTLMAAGLLSLAVAWLGSGGRLPRGAAAFAAASLLAKAAIIGAAHRHEGFVQKDAAYLPAVIWEAWRLDGAEALLVRPNFAPTALIASPGYAISGPNYQATAVVHSLAIGLGAAVVAAALGCASMAPTAWWVLLLMTWSPSSVYWGMHGLRDPMIFLAMAVAAGGALRIAGGQRGGWGGVPWITAAIAMLLVVRPELSPLPAVAAVVASFASREARGVRALAIVAMVGGALAVPLILQAELGIDELSAGSVAEAASLREMRALEQGNESSLYGQGSLVRAAPALLPARIAIQFVGLAACPLPRLPRGAGDLAVAFESMAWMAALAAPWLATAKRGPRARAACRVCSLVAVAGLLAYAPLTVNAGNAFRLRFSVLPFAVVSAALVCLRPRAAEPEAGRLHARHA